MSGEKLNNKFHWGFALILVTIFQVLTGTVAITGNGFNSKLFVIYAGFIILEWGYFIIASTFFGQNNFEIEIIGFLFSGIRKEELFPAVTASGSLPRKTFSMGQARDKRYYMEARLLR